MAIDVDALIREEAQRRFAAHRVDFMNRYPNSGFVPEWPQQSDETHAAWIDEVLDRQTLELVANRAEQAVFDRLEALAADEVRVGESHFDNDFNETGPEVIARFISVVRVARGGSDAN